MLGRHTRLLVAVTVLFTGLALGLRAGTAVPRRWLRCQFHCHSTRSDGLMPYEEALDRYAALGYDVLAVTDHDVWGPGGRRGDMLVIAGNEVSECDHHCVHLGSNPRDRVRILAHPAYSMVWHYRAAGAGGKGRAMNLTPARFRELMRRYDAWEIYNATAEAVWDEAGAPQESLADSSELRLLARGRPEVAADDMHHPCMLGWTVTWVYARLDEADVLEAIRRGRVRTEILPPPLGFSPSRDVNPDRAGSGPQ